MTKTDWDENEEFDERSMGGAVEDEDWEQNNVKDGYGTEEMG